MSHIFLDPGAAHLSASTGPVIEQLPQKTRAFGFYPDLGAMQAGDVLLVSPVKSGASAKAISMAQRRDQPDDQAIWVHAALYLGDDSIIELDGRGVGINELSKYVPSHRILVRRILDDTGAPIEADIGYRIAIAALKAHNTKYDEWLLISIAKQALNPSQRDYSMAMKRAAVCSTFVDRAVVRVLRRTAVTARHEPYRPADLASSTGMTDVPVQWLRLP